MLPGGDGAGLGDTVRLYADGACRGNPGPGGWGAILVDPAGRHRVELRGSSGLTTNNRMELTAVIEGLARLRRPVEVDVYSDSRYVVQGMSEWIHDWVRRGWKTAAKKPVLNEDLWRTLKERVAAQKAVRFHWVAGHAGHPENERCDALANEAIDELLGVPPPRRRAVLPVSPATSSPAASAARSSSRPPAAPGRGSGRPRKPDPPPAAG